METQNITLDSHGYKQSARLTCMYAARLGLQVLLGYIVIPPFWNIGELARKMCFGLKRAGCMDFTADSVVSWQRWRQQDVF